MRGGCTCGHVRYALLKNPLIVHCCHCTWCQRESGSAFAVNILIETQNVRVDTGNVVLVGIPSPSGRGQIFARCPECQIALWSHYGGSGKKISFVRAGTLDEPKSAPPDIHIFTRSKQSFVTIPTHMPRKSQFYDRNTVWSQESLDRRKAVMSRL